MPKVSVIIPVYNSEKYLKQCLNSAIKQTLKDIEIICVDDGSTDKSKDILKEYSEKDKRIIILEQENQYAGVARNNAIQVAKGEYIHFLDSDDWLKNKNTYKYLYKRMKKTQSEVAIFQFNKVDTSSGEVTENKRVLRKNNDISNIEEEPYFFAYGYVQPWNKLYSRKYILDNNLKFDTTIAANDRVFFIHTILTAKKIMVCRKVFMCYRINNKESLIGEVRLKNFECHFDSYESVKEVSKDAETNIKRLILDITMKDFLGFFHKTYIVGYEKYRIEIFNKLHNYFQTMDVSLCEENPTQYSWWDEYVAIKAGNIDEAEEKYKKINDNKNNKIQENIIIYYIKRCIKFIKRYGLVYTIQTVLLNIKKKLGNRKK